MIKKGLIPAAGQGQRLYPLTKTMPKVMIEVGGKPLLLHNIEIMRDKLGIEEITIIINNKGDSIKRYFEYGERFEINIDYIVQTERQGIAKAISLAQSFLDEPFVVILGDELYLRTNHHRIKDLLLLNFDAICTFKAESNKERISNNFTGLIENGVVKSLTEKPEKPSSNLLGCGTYVLNPVVFDYIDKTPASALRNEVEITDVLNNMAVSGRKVLPFILEGEYVNVNKVSDIELANKMISSVKKQKC